MLCDVTRNLKYATTLSSICCDKSTDQFMSGQSSHLMKLLRWSSWHIVYEGDNELAPRLHQRATTTTDCHRNFDFLVRSHYYATPERRTICLNFCVPYETSPMTSSKSDPYVSPRARPKKNKANQYRERSSHSTLVCRACLCEDRFFLYSLYSDDNSIHLTPGLVLCYGNDE